MKHEEAVYINSLFDPSDPESRIACANALLELRGKAPIVTDIQSAKTLLRLQLHALLGADQYTTAAALCWGTRLFDPRPRSVRLIWKGLQTKPRLLIFGAGSMGKSYTVMGWGLLRWEEDPEGTTIKLVSTTAGHARANTFSTLVMFYNNSCVPFSGYIRQGFIGLDKYGKRSSIAEVAIPQGEDGKGRLQGFHPLPRLKPHPKFGDLTTVIGFFDEAEDIPNGLWKGEANMMLTMDDTMHVQMCAMWNPKRRDSVVAQKAEPLGGWSALDERLDEYESKANYWCIRLDARKCENVIERRVIYPGLQTYEGFKELEQKGGADFDTFGKGIYPSEMATMNIISLYTCDRSRGTFLWATRPVEIATFDTANEVEGEAMFSAGKFGAAVAFQPEKGAIVRYQKPRWSMQIEQQFPVIKQELTFMGDTLIGYLNTLRVKPEWFAMDRTGNGSFLHDWMVLNYGPCLGIQWGQKSTEVPILDEDGEKACDLYDDIRSEMHFSAAAWLQFGYIAFAPHMDTSKLFAQLTGRRYKRISKIKRQVESKDDFKKRYSGQSPNEGDSFVMMVQLVRTNADPKQMAAMAPDEQPPLVDFMAKPQMGAQISFESSNSPVDKVKFVG